MGNSCRRVATTHLVGFTCLVLFPLLALLPLHAAEFYNDWATNNLSLDPSHSGPTDDPDADGTPNLAEYAFGTNPRVSDSIYGGILPLPTESNGVFRVVLFERAGHRPGVQIDLDATADLTNWIRPWWLRELTNSLPGDPPGSVRELLTTYLPDTNIFIVRGVIELLEAGPEVANYYVATNGSDTASGTSTNTPFRSVHKAHSVASPGNLIYVRGGTYTTNTTLTISRNGSAASPIRLRAYPGEHPILSFSPQSDSDGNRGINLQASWWRIYGLEVLGAGDNGLNITGNSNIVELCVFHDNRDSGLQLGDDGHPSSNLVLNCDSYHNNDSKSEDADGFAPKLSGLGKDNAFRGCRAWENADDGWDMYQAPNPVYIENCWSFRNGHYGTKGDRNGFKLGGIGVGASHHVVDCVAFNNSHHGYDQNNNLAGQTLDNNTAWHNGSLSGRNFNLYHTTTSNEVHTLRNNLSIDGTVAATPMSILISNSWQVLTPDASVSDVLSTNEDYALYPRRDDGGLPETPFLRPVPGGRLVDQGTNIGAAFNGSAPDLGAFETPVW